jgi:hypothetical protein
MLFAWQVKHPQKKLPPALAAAVYTSACLLSFDNTVDLDLQSARSFGGGNYSGVATDQQAWLQGGQGRNQIGRERSSVPGPNPSSSQRGSGSQRYNNQQYVAVKDGRGPRSDPNNYGRSPSTGQYPPSDNRYNNSSSGRNAYFKRPKGGGGA